MKPFRDKRAVGPSREEQLREAAERKKEIAAKLLRRREIVHIPRSRLERLQSPDQEVRARNTTTANASVSTSTAIQEAHPVALDMRLWDDAATSEIRVVSAVEHLAGHLLHAAVTRQHQTVLLWPGSLRSLSFAHAVATVARWHSGDKRGLRTLVYPAKANFLQPLNHAHIDRGELVRIAQSLDETFPNSNVRVSLKDKDPFWFALNSIRPDEADLIHPTVAELLPHYFADKEFRRWRSCDGDLLRHVKARISNPHHRRALDDGAIKALSDPASAPDAIFAISWRASQDDIMLALRQLRNGRCPDVVALDATRSIRKGNPLWKANLVRFVECLRETWPNSTPPVVVVIDEPHVRDQLRRELEKRASKKSAAAIWLLNSLPGTNGVVCSSTREALIAAGQTEPLTPSARTIHIAITDTEAASVTESIERLRNGALEARWKQSLDEASVYLARLAALPSSTRVLVQWLDEAAVPMTVRSTYAWPVYRSKLEQILHETTFGEKDRLRRIIERGNALWTNYENGTPLARKLADLIEEHTRGAEKGCVVFTRPTARRLAERYFETYDGYPDGAGFEVLRDSVRFVVSRNLNSEAAPRAGETLILVGLDEDSLQFLLLDERVSSPAYVLLTRRNATYLKATLRAIRSTSGFKSLAPRIDTLLNQLPDFQDVDERTLFARSDFVLPTFSFEQGLSSTATEQEENDPNAWLLTLEGGLSIRRSPQSRAYVYDPALSHTPSHGFRGIDVKDLQEGDRLFVMSFELREMTEVALKEAGIPIANDKRFETDLRLYHERINQLGSTLPPGLFGSKVKDMHAQLSAALGPKGDLPTENTVRNWMSVDRFRGKSFEDAKPGAPRKELHFKAFAKIIGLDDYEAVYFWKAVIQPLRGVRRADGRRVSDVYTELLLEPECAVVHRRLRHTVVQALFARAKENVHVIEAIYKPKRGDHE